MWRTVLLAAAASASACVLDLTIPPGARVRCASDNECPEGYLCDPLEELCVRKIVRVNRPPQVVVDPVASAPRQLGDVAFWVTVFDADDSEVNLNVEYDDGSGFAPASVTPTEVGAAADGMRHEITWNASHDLATGSAYAEGLRLRVMPADPTESGELTSAKLSVFLRAIDYVRAADGQAVLPRLANGEPFIRRTATWIKVREDTDGDLRTGSGPRYVLAGLGGSRDRRFVRVLVDRFGLVQAFIH